MTLRSLMKASACGVLVLLAGCATVYEDRYAFADGWRRGTIDAILPLEQVHQRQVRQCPEPKPQADDVWVVVRYRRFDHTLKLAIPAPRDKWRVEQKVFVNLRSECVDALVPMESDDQ